MIRTVIDVDDYTVGFSIGVGLFATGVLFAVRFVGVALGARDLKEKDPKERLRSWAILTLSGVKGTVSLATAFSLPLALYGGKVFEHRDFLLLVTACAIMFSLVISTIFLPIIAKPKRSRRKNNLHVRIIRDVIPTVEASFGACANAIAIHLRRRVRELEYEDLGVDQKKRVDIIKRDFTKREHHLLETQKSNSDITDAEYADCLRISSLASVMQDASLVRRYINRIRFTLRLIGEPKGSRRNGATEDMVDARRLQELFWSNTGKVGSFLERKYGKNDDEIISRIIEERVDIATTIMDRYYGNSVDIKLNDEYDREVKRCFRLERQKLDEYIDSGKISEDEADEIRVEINTLETYAIRDVQSDTLARRFMQQRKGRRLKSHKKR
jgi:CPA1 family monovalent cation:H+ antiporter